jgi:hypothetical protein
MVLSFVFLARALYWPGEAEAEKPRPTLMIKNKHAVESQHRRDSSVFSIQQVSPSEILLARVPVTLRVRVER